MSILSVNNTLQSFKDNEALPKLIKYFEASNEAIASAQYQLHKIQLIDWTHNSDNGKFWSEVHQYRDSSGCNPFKELYEIAMMALLLPHSNAHVKRLFSCINRIKSKTRNQMELQLLRSLLTIKFVLMRYVLPTKVRNAIGTLRPVHTISFSVRKQWHSTRKTIFSSLLHQSRQ